MYLNYFKVLMDIYTHHSHLLLICKYGTVD